MAVEISRTFVTVSTNGNDRWNMEIGLGNKVIRTIKDQSYNEMTRQMELITNIFLDLEERGIVSYAG